VKESFLFPVEEKKKEKLPTTKNPPLLRKGQKIHFIFNLRGGKEKVDALGRLEVSITPKEREGE